MAERLLNRVRERRDQRGWTQVELAQQTGVSRKTVNTNENHVFEPSTLVALKLAKALDAQVEELFWLAEG